jgi:dinuclear metal center YbgI/SA1388 family protein
MICKELIRVLKKQSPEYLACDWDNVGLLVGSRQQEIQTVYIALDATDEVIEAAVRAGADLLLTHHPIIFGGLKKVNTDDMTGRRVVRLIEEHMCCYAMHTNFDIRGMAQLAAERISLKEQEVLQVEYTEDETDEGIGRFGILSQPMSLYETAQLVKEAFDLENVRVFGNPDSICKVAAISPGSGKSMIDAALESGSDVFITGDIDHHTGIDAVAMGLSIIDAGHYGIEHIFIDYMADYLRKECPHLQVITDEIRHPFTVV